MQPWGTHLLLPLDIVEVTYLLPPPESILLTGDLIVRRAIALQKRQGDLECLHSRVFAEHRKQAIRFKKVHMQTIKDYAFERRDLAPMRNTVVEKQGGSLYPMQVRWVSVKEHSRSI